MNSKKSAAAAAAAETAPAKKTIFKKVSMFAEKWTGRSPQDINPDLARDDTPKYSDKDVLLAAIVIHGFIKLQGEFEGRPRPFVVMCCTTPQDVYTPFTVSSSGMVVIKKLERIGDKSGFPVLGKIIKDKSYFDLVDAEENDETITPATSSSDATPF
jgi:hypothetical protein